ncbi:MAG: hypothetical protein KAR01_14285, partial [Desulfocapsa sp.]|nr:hypothetical protein [Desulfocapsa sp.]
MKSAPYSFFTAALLSGMCCISKLENTASCLSSLDDLIVAHNDKLKALKDHKKGLVQNLFPHTSTGSKKKVPNYRFPEFAKDGEWEIRSVEENIEL